ncbi:DUF4845 domain-containing protein [Propionivibrio limicola]|uniref:DUF4845 domain-containing protein n=1 Tax=Propionivibrio limicola TaxID=167645 RepID=UPI0012918D72|nr:DUF4845 domain-containing protein [Propionivibrio limicola]
MRKQRGLSLSGLLFWGVIISLVAILGMKVTPEYITYFKILKATKAVANDAGGKTVPEIRTAFGKYMEVEHVSEITPADLQISKQGNAVMIDFSYDKQIHLFHNVSLLIEFEGSSAGNSSGE